MHIWIPPSVPVLHAEESIQCYANRALKSSGVARAKTFYTQLLGIRSDHPNAHKIDSSSKKFQKEMGQAGHRFRRSAFEDHAFSAVGLPFRAPERIAKRWSVRRRQRRRDDRANSGIPHTIVRERPAFCIECTKADFETHGYSYWRRAPQITGVTYCVQHKTPLSAYCESCGTRWNENMMPPAVCPSCSKPVRARHLDIQDPVQAVQFRFSEAIDAMYKGGITGPMTSKSILHRLATVIANPEGPPGQSALEYFEQIAGKDYLDQFYCLSKTVLGVPWTAGLYASNTIVCDATFQALIYALLSYDKPRLEMFWKDFPQYGEWLIVDHPLSAVPNDWPRKPNDAIDYGYQPQMSLDL